MARWVWFALDPERRLADGEQDAVDGGTLQRTLRGRGLEPLLVLTRARWQRDLAGGPAGVAPPVRTAVEIAMLRAEGTLELPPMRAAAASHGHGAHHPNVLRRRRPSRRPDAPQPVVAVHARPWSSSLVSVAVRTLGDEVLRGTERLFPTDDAGLAAAAEWKGQLEFVCEQWLLDAPIVAESGEGSGDAPDEAPDARAAARLLDDGLP